LNQNITFVSILRAGRLNTGDMTLFGALFKKYIQKRYLPVTPPEDDKRRTPVLTGSTPSGSQIGSRFHRRRAQDNEGLA
jgi:hypothetical protein